MFQVSKQQSMPRNFSNINCIHQFSWHYSFSLQTNNVGPWWPMSLYIIAEQYHGSGSAAILICTTAITFFQNVIMLTSSHRSLVNHHDIVSDVITTSCIQWHHHRKHLHVLVHIFYCSWLLTPNVDEFMPTNMVRPKTGLKGVKY